VEFASHWSVRFLPDLCDRGEHLVLRASKNAHPDCCRPAQTARRPRDYWLVAEHHEPVAISEKAALDPISIFHEFAGRQLRSVSLRALMSRGRVVGAINLQHRLPHTYKRKEIRLISAIGFLVGAEIELARLEEINSNPPTSCKREKLWSALRGFCSANCA